MNRKNLLWILAIVPGALLWNLRPGLEKPQLQDQPMISPISAPERSLISRASERADMLEKGKELAVGSGSDTMLNASQFSYISVTP